MPVFIVLLALLISVPLVEIYVLIQVGRVIGAGTTVVLVVLTAVAGAWLLRWQGLSTIARVQAALAAGELPALELVEGLILLLTAVLLLTPGFVTDALGFVVLVPPVRRWLARAVARHLVLPPRGGGGPGTGTPHHRTIDADYRVEDD